jgi:hypothetical protein
VGFGELVATLIGRRLSIREHWRVDERGCERDLQDQSVNR